MVDKKKKIESSLEYWLHAIELKAPDSVVIVVGTHLDLASTMGKSKEPPSSLKNKFSKLVSKWMTVSCTTGEGMDQLRDYLISLAIERAIEVPAQWIRFGKALKDEASGSPFIEMEDVKRLANQPTHEFEENNLSLAIQVLHNIGNLLYYPPSSMEESNIIILDPQWLVNILKAIITVNKVPGMNGGWLSHNEPTLERVWPGISPSLHSFLLGLLYRFKIAIKSKGQSLIPCRLESVPSGVAEKYQRMVVEFEFTQILPEDLFPTLVASPKVYHYINLDSNDQIWKDAAILQDEDEKIWLFVRVAGKNIQLFGEGPSNLLLDIIKATRSTASKNWPGKIGLDYGFTLSQVFHSI